MSDVTIVTAAWHRQANLDVLLPQHVASLLSQTVDFQVIYVVDGGADLDVPDDPRIEVVRVPRPLTTAQALNTGLAITDTEFFAVCNLDDYWFPDALEVQLAAMREGELDLVGGDWEIRNDLVADLDRKSFPISELRVCDSWPPKPGPGQRLGSGDGRRGTYGPAPVMRTTSLRSVGGYPRRFGDGTPIKTIIDYIVWDLMTMRSKRLGRLPLVIGSYFSSPETQQEFRSEGDQGVDDEHRLYNLFGVEA